MGRDWRCQPRIILQRGNGSYLEDLPCRFCHWRLGRVEHGITQVPNLDLVSLQGIHLGRTVVDYMPGIAKRHTTNGILHPSQHHHRISLPGEEGEEEGGVRTMVALSISCSAANVLSPALATLAFQSLISDWAAAFARGVVRLRYLLVIAGPMILR